MIRNSVRSGAASGGRAWRIAAAAVVAACGSASGQHLLSFHAQPPESPQQPPKEREGGIEVSLAKELQYYQPDWNIQVEAVAWFVAPGGFVQLPGGSAIAWYKDFNNDSPHLSPYTEINVREGDWRLALSGATYSSSGRTSLQAAPGSIGGVSFAAGDTVLTSLDFATVQAEVGYRVPISVRSKGPRPTFFSTWEVVAGARFFNVQTEFAAPGGTASGSGFFGAPYVGGRVAFEIAHGFSLDLSANIGYFSDGGGTSTLTTDIANGFVWRPTANIGVEIGYRQLTFGLTSGEGTSTFEMDGALAGLFIGVVARF